MIGQVGRGRLDAGFSDPCSCLDYIFAHPPSREDGQRARSVKRLGHNNRWRWKRQQQRTRDEPEQSQYFLRFQRAKLTSAEVERRAVAPVSLFVFIHNFFIIALPQMFKYILALALISVYGTFLSDLSCQHLFYGSHLPLNASGSDNIWDIVP